MVYHQKIAEKINAAQSGNKDSILDLMNMFRPLLRSLATHLNYEDAINDLELEFIQLIKTIKLSLLRSCDDGSIIRYIQQSLKYKSYQLSNTHRAKMRTEIPHCSYSEEQLFAIVFFSIGCAITMVHSSRSAIRTDKIFFIFYSPL